jgi:hypothetical protein
MTAPEHYREAERLLDARARNRRNRPSFAPAPGSPGRTAQTVPAGESVMAEAQVHAILALAAATALGDISDADERAWRDAAVNSRPVTGTLGPEPYG